MVGIIKKSASVTTVLGLILLSGCSKDEPQANLPTEPKKEQIVPAVQVSQAKEKPAPGSFTGSVVLDPPEGESCPPGETYTKKSIGKIFESIRGAAGAPGLWDQIRFVNSQGRKIEYSVLVKTDLGDFRIALFPEAAPNHVKNFLALARAGYYDGLPFYKSTRESIEGKTRGLIEAGCPRGTGELGYGSIGYWLKSEIKDDLFHEDGTVGAWQSRHPVTGEPLHNAACKFYITVGQPLGMDGNFTIFGKVVEGLDVVHRMNQRPIQLEDILNNTTNVVLIRQVQIEERVSAGTPIVGN